MGLVTVATFAAALPFAARIRGENLAQEVLVLSYDTVVARVGQPDSEFEGFFGFPPLDYQIRHPKTTTYVFTVSGGRIYASFDRAESQLRCFTACFVGKRPGFFRD